MLTLWRSLSANKNVSQQEATNPTIYERSESQSVELLSFAIGVIKTAALKDNG